MKTCIIKICALGLTILALFFCLKLCSNKQIDSSIRDRTQLAIDIGAEIPSFDPQLIEDMSSIRVSNDLFEGLVTFDQTNNVIPGLAESWLISGDGKTYTFYLRKRINFSDGIPITANDVVYSWQRLVDPKTGSPYTLIASSILNAQEIEKRKLPSTALGIKALNNKTVVVNLAYPDADFLAKVTRPSFAVVPKHVVSKYGNSWTNPKNIVTSGAYLLKSHIVNGEILISKNPYYYDDSSVQIQNIRFFPLTDANSAIAKYKSGELDVTWSIPINQFKKLLKKYQNQMQITPIEATVYYNINMLMPELKSFKIRKALSLAIDREVLTKYVLGNGVKPLYSIITPTIDNGKYANVKYSWQNDSNSQRITLARKLYKEAGYGINHQLKLTITHFTNDEQKKVAIAIASMWKSVLGINISIENQDWKTFLQTRRNGNYFISFGRWYADYNGVSTYTSIFECDSAVNYAKYCNKSYDEYINEALITSDNLEKTATYSKALNIALNDYSIIPLYQLVSARLVKPYVKGYPTQINNLDMVKSKWLNIR